MCANDFCPLRNVFPRKERGPCHFLSGATISTANRTQTLTCRQSQCQGIRPSLVKRGEYYIDRPCAICIPVIQNYKICVNVTSRDRLRKIVRDL